ncbi:MAG: hypothetical protein ACREHG_01720, partial [Candidatus Saccharimonadales bacterium]
MREAVQIGIDNSATGSKRRRRPRKGIGFCNDVFNIMWKYGMIDQWKTILDDGDPDNVAVWRWWNGVQGHHPGKKEIVERKQQEAWRERLLKTAKGPFYLNCKKQWGMDPSLHQHGSRSGRVWKTRMKASAVPLQAELMREHRAQTDVCG